MVLFVISAFLLLVIHELLVDSRGNDLYLYQVARSTAYLLSWVGHSSRVVGHPKTYPGKEAYIRARMEAWGKGQKPPPPEQFEGMESPPLTPWESWEYSAMSQRRELAELLKTWEERGDLWRFNPMNKAQVEEMKSRIQTLQNQDLGPSVSFVLRPGLVSEMAEARQAMAEARRDRTLSEEERLARVAAARARLVELEEKWKKAAETAPETVNDLAFRFCGGTGLRGDSDDGDFCGGGCGISHALVEEACWSGGGCAFFVSGECVPFDGSSGAWGVGSRWRHIQVYA